MRLARRKFLSHSDSPAAAAAATFGETLGEGDLRGPVPHPVPDQPSKDDCQTNDAPP
jgi:hypothetical protein